MDPRTDPHTPSAGSATARRELLLFGGALAFGLAVIPFLIWLVGHWTLGPYTHGDTGPGHGPLTLFADYFVELAHGSPGYWIVAAGPVLLLGGVRLWLKLIRRFPGS